MRILYLNNFRGFENTFIPLRKVNFFVGENSTGKSSVLSIIKLMTSPSFWLSDDFNTEEIELGYYNELTISKAGQKKRFQLGFHIDDDDKRDNHAFKTILLTYINSNGSPKLKEIRVFVEGFSAYFILHEDRIQYKIKQSKINFSEGKSAECFKNWISDISFSKIAYKVHDLSDKEYSSVFMLIRNLLRKELEPRWEAGNLSRPAFTPPLIWIAPIRTRPRRIYEAAKLVYSSSGGHAPFLIKNILLDKFRKEITKTEFSSIINKFGKDSGLFDKIAIDNLGKDITSPFILTVFLNNQPIKITNVGYGVGQVLPLLAETLAAGNDKWFAIQQPEVHLHPKAQAALGDYLFFMSIKKSINFLIETHSDYLIDRFRLSNKNSTKEKIDSQVLFFERKGNCNMVSSIKILQNGQYEENQPKMFRDFFINEEFKLLSI